MCIDWKPSWVLWFSNMLLTISNDNIHILFVLFVCSNIVKYDLNKGFVFMFCKNIGLIISIISSLIMFFF
jgi:hypothetical protein